MSSRTAEVDVEAQEDGIMGKILVGDLTRTLQAGLARLL